MRTACAQRGGFARNRVTGDAGEGIASASPRRASRERAVFVTPASTRTGDLVLVDDSHPAGGTAHERLLAPFADQPRVLLARRAAVALAAAFEEAGVAGRVAAASGYRTTFEQTRLWEEAVREHGEPETSRRVARPGASEHECGLAVDLCRRWPVGGGVRLGFPRTGACGRLREVLPRHGFVERYPAGGEKITGFDAEPWHFRYVGTTHALAMSRLRLTLEEWLELLEREAPVSRPLLVAPDGTVEPAGPSIPAPGGHLVAHAPVDEATTLALPHAETLAFATVSGTNAGGVVVTWPCPGTRPSDGR